MNEASREQPNYRWVWLTFVRNALIREMTFRGNFLITVMTRALWFCSQILLFKIIFHNVQHITRAGTSTSTSPSWRPGC